MRRGKARRYPPNGGGWRAVSHSRLFAAPIKRRAALRITQQQIDWLETQIDAATAELSPLTSFILPGGVPGAATLHVARAVVRRAERAVVHLTEVPDQKVNRLVLVYLNRLSDLLFVLARMANAGGQLDVLWVPQKGGNG